MLSDSRNAKETEPIPIHFFFPIRAFSGRKGSDPANDETFVAEKLCIKMFPQQCFSVCVRNKLCFSERSETVFLLGWQKNVSVTYVVCVCANAQTLGNQ